MLSSLIIQSVPITCINRAAIIYSVPATVIISVLKTEGGQVGLASLNKNGTVDYGPMQVNSVFLKQIAPYGYTQQQIQYNPCINLMVGVWILSREIANGKSYWQGVANYHSHTETLNQSYQQQVWYHYRKLQHTLGH